MAERTLIRQDRQIKNSVVYNDNLGSGSNLQSQASSIQYDLNAIRSQLKNILGESNWYSAPSVNLHNFNANNLSEVDHNSLNTLTHDISENCYINITRDLNRISTITIWDSSLQILKIREFNITRTNDKVSQITVTQYNDAGAPLITLTKTINRNIQNKITSITYMEN